MSLIFQWSGKAMEPLSPASAALQFVEGERYRLEVREERSDASHNHFFAAVEEAWDNLPERLMERFPTADHLRKWSLIKTGFRDERTIVCSSNAEAQHVAKAAKLLDDYAVVVAREAMVVCWTAKSQSAKAMSKKEFAASKDAVLAEISRLIGTSTETLQANAGRAA